MVYNYTKPRRPVMASLRGPGPCYALPGLMGDKLRHDPRSVHHKGPAYSFRVKHGKWGDDCSPGPKYALNSKMLRGGKEEKPMYSITGRPKSVDAAKTPGPAAYSPEKCGQQAYYRHPTYAFGMRTKSRALDKTPGPAEYNTADKTTVVSGRKSAPAYSMVPKTAHGHFTEDLAKTPGPNAYRMTNLDTYKSAPPKYSMTSRNMRPGDNTKKPGPGAHYPEKVNSKKSPPAFSFGIRHSEYEAPLIVAES